MRSTWLDGQAQNDDGDEAEDLTRDELASWVADLEWLQRIAWRDELGLPRDADLLRLPPVPPAERRAA